jgi:hypothetical protein
MVHITGQQRGKLKKHLIDEMKHDKNERAGENQPFLYFQDYLP